MSNYDFENQVDRRNTGSMKWEDMYKQNPSISKDAVPLSVADMEFVVAPEIRDGLIEFLQKNPVLGYTSAYEEFYDSVIGWMKKRHEFEIKKEWIVNTHGIVSALYTSVDAYTNENDGVIIMSPVYYPFSMAIKDQNRKIVDCPLINKDGRYTIDYELLDKQLSKDENKILIFCSPHNPVGRVWKKEELEKLAEIIKKHKKIILSDEIHFDLIMPGNKHTVFQTLDKELEDLTVTFTAPSKTFNLAGLGLSNVIIKNENLRKKFLNSMNKTHGFVTTIFSYKACQLAYQNSEKWLDECINTIKENEDIMIKFFKENYPQVKLYDMEGTYLLWADFNSFAMDYKELEKFCVEEAELILDQGYIFGDEGKGFVRFNLACPRKTLENALRKLDLALKNKLNI